MHGALVTALLIGSTIHGTLVTALFIGSTMRKVPFVITPILRCIIRFRRQYIGLQLTLSIIPTSRLTTIKQAMLIFTYNVLVQCIDLNMIYIIYYICIKN